MSTEPSTEAIYKAHGDYLWGLAFRMLGVGADADEVVQEAFVRLLRAEPDRSRDVRPWLVRVTTNLARDRLRARKREAYPGPWLPAVTEEQPDEAVPGARYSTAESLSLGFLWAAEQLDDKQRAVLVLRDVLGHSVRETADTLGLSESNVKVIAHRVHSRMKTWEDTQRRSLAVPHERVVDAMRRFFGAVAAGDRAAAEATLAEDVCLLSDGGGEYFAARKPVLGVAKVAGFNLKIASAYPMPSSFELRTLGGVPSMVLHRPGAPEGVSPRSCVQMQLDDAGLIHRIYILLTARKVGSMLAGPRYGVSG